MIVPSLDITAQLITGSIIGAVAITALLAYYAIRAARRK
jgi:hypothetical protein